MLSSISKLADRTFILGAFLPTLLFIIFLLLEFRDQEFATSMLGKDLGKAAYLILIVWAAAVMLTMFNHNIYRFLEGYTFPSPLARWGRSRQVRRFLNLKKELSKDIDQSAYNSLSIEIFSKFPSKKEEFLPTSFGNALKSFEVYPRDIYGIDAIRSWPRL